MELNRVVETQLLDFPLVKSRIKYKRNFARDNSVQKLNNRVKICLGGISTSQCTEL